MSTPDTRLRVVSLVAQNILRLSAIDIKWSPDQSVLTLGGANGAGKSSAVNCVAMSLGGMALCPEEPLKRGESSGFVKLDLGELRIQRDFWRDALPCDCGVTNPGDVPIVGDDVMHLEKCASHKFGDVKSRLVVRNADGITQGTPQAILDKLVGRMTFDPMAFVNMDTKPQEDTLRRIVNLDVSEHETARKIAFERRAGLNRQHKDAVAVLTAWTTFDDVPTEEISFDEITSELRRAEELRNVARDAEAALSSAKSARETHGARYDSISVRIDRITRELEEATKELSLCDAIIKEADETIKARTASVAAARAAVPDVEAISVKLKDVEKTNEKVRANRAYVHAADAAKKLAAQIEEQENIINAAEAAKRAALDAATFPVPGLSLSDHGVTFNDLPFKQASTAEQIRVSVAIGFALHPKLKLLLVKNGNALDDDSLQLIANEAAAAGGQILMEYVTKDASDVSVFIEDGHTT